jgi:hypothetical protein
MRFESNDVNIGSVPAEADDVQNENVVSTSFWAERTW